MSRIARIACAVAIVTLAPLAARAQVSVVSGHPRVYLRPGELDALRTRAGSAAVAPYYNELKSRMDGGEPVHIVDLRHSLDFDAEPVTLPGANRLAVEEIEARHGEIPRDRDIVLYCT